MSEETALVAKPRSTNPADSENTESTTTSENIIPAEKEQIQDELEHRVKLLQIYRNNLRRYEEQAAMLGSQYVSPGVLNSIEETKENIINLEKDISSLQKVEITVSEGKSIVKQEDRDLPFMPEWSVLRSKIQYVDANLAYRFADASADANILMSFTTLFLGAFISFAVAAILATEIFSTTLLWTATAFSLVATAIFGYLSKRADDRAKEVKKQLFPVNELK